MVTRNLYTIAIAIFTSFQVNAQAHDNRGNACRILGNRGPGTAVEEGAFCAACVKKDKMEREAKEAESVRRAKVQAEKNKAEQIARKQALEKERKESDAKLKAGEVYVTMPKNTYSKNPAPVKKVLPNKAGAVPSKGILLISDDNGGFKNINDEVIIAEKSFLSTEGAIYYENINRNKFPKDLGIVTLEKKINQLSHAAYHPYSRRGDSYNITDLIDNKGNRRFNSDKISFIRHLYGDWFVIGSDFYSKDFYSIFLGNAKLYNVKNKGEILLPLSPFHKAVDLGKNKYSDFVANPCYVSGTYTSVSAKKKSEILLDGLAGGSDKWKAYIFSSISITQHHTEHKIFYINSKDEIIELNATREDWNNFLDI